MQASFNLKIHTDVVFLNPRSVSNPLKTVIEKDVERLKMLEPIGEWLTYSDWASPIVPVPKDDSTVRICGD